MPKPRRKPVDKPMDKKTKLASKMDSSLDSTLELAELLVEEERDGAEISAPADSKVRATSIYDEYRDLLEETKQTHAIEDAAVGPPLDVNLLSSLVYWVSLAKQRVGEEQLKDLIQLYIQSGHSRPELQDLLLHVSKMVDTEPMDVGESTGDWLDLMFHLHGILTGGFPVVKIPQIRLPVPEVAEGDGS